MTSLLITLAEARMMLDRSWGRRSRIAGLGALVAGAVVLLGTVALIGRTTTATAVGSDQDAEVALIKRICRDNSEVPIQRIGVMRKIIELVRRNSEQCRSRYLTAMYELSPIIETDQPSLCEAGSIERIKQYHFRYIQPFRRANRAPTQFDPEPRNLVKAQLYAAPRKYTVEIDENKQAMMAPIAVRHFFLKFALQVSKKCKKELVANMAMVEDKGSGILNDQDRELMDLFRSDSPIGQSIASSVDYMNFDNVLYIPELDGKRYQANGKALDSIAGQQQQLRVSAIQDSALFNIIFACKTRFQPIYEKLIMPVVRLSKLGYDYLNEQRMTEPERFFLNGPRLKNWFVVVHICDIIKNVALLIDSKPAQVPPSAEEVRSERKRRLHRLLGQIEREEADADADANTEADTEVDTGINTEKGTASNPQNAPGEEVGPMTDEELAAAAAGGTVVDDELAKQLAPNFEPLHYEPTIRTSIGNELEIRSKQELDRELARKHGSVSPHFLRAFLMRASNFFKRTLAKFDFERFSHYRHNSLFYAGLVNFLCICTSVMSIVVTIVSAAG